ncbi:MAG: hypothetical protein JWM21_1336 [Acidobacteria bacterium]|nr:hypothetical protein [Acidobacteriota bacterium]
MDPEEKTNKLKERHNNIRHITQLGMSWFAFFVTVNYLTMGWLAKAPRDQADPFIIGTVAVVFIVQNFLGIFGLAWVLIATMAIKIQIDNLEHASTPDSKSEVIPAMTFRNFLQISCRSKKAEAESIPAALYTRIGRFLVVVLISLTLAWTVILCRYPF